MTTGLGYPKKADDAQAHPSVSLLFSDPTGSGIDSGLRVLVQGTATVDDEDLKANAERYVRESGVKLPGHQEDEPAEAAAPDVQLVLRAPLHQGAARNGSSSGRRGTSQSEPTLHDARLDEVRSGHVEEPPEDHGEAPKGLAGLGPADGLPG